MSDQAKIAKIGPITIPKAQVVDGDDFSEDGEKVQFFGSDDLVNQIVGLTGTVQKANSGSMKVMSTDSPWGPIWIDGSVVLKDNIHLTHRAWYLPNKPTPKTIAPGYSTLDLNLEKISNHRMEVLDVDYSVGYNDGTLVDNDYGVTFPTYLIQDSFDALDTTIWQQISTWGGNVSCSNSNLVLNTSGGTPDIQKFVGIETIKSYKPPFTLECDMQKITSPSSPYENQCRMIISEGQQEYGGESPQLQCDMMVQNGIAYDAVWKLIGPTNKSWANLVANIVDNNITRKWKVELDKDCNAKIYIDNGGGYVQRYSGPTGLDATNGFYIALILEINTSESQTVQYGFCNLYSYIASSTNNIVAAPAGAKLLNKSADFTRASADGPIPCFVNPNERIEFQIDPDNLYDGSIKSLNSNPDDVSRLVTSEKAVLDPLKFQVSNGIVKLITTSNSVQFWGWNGTTYTMLDEFTFSNAIKLLKPIFVGPDRFTFQIDNTKWTMWRGKPFIQVEHSNDNLRMTLATTYYHDGTTTTSPAVGADITMQTQNYCTLINTGNYGVEIIKADPCTIKSDEIPASDLTMIGFFNNTVSTSSYDHYSKIPLEAMVHPIQRISIKQV